MARIYFKQHHESNTTEWTSYGTYCEDDLTEWGDACVNVYDITFHSGQNHIEWSAYREYICPDEVTKITKEEYESVISKIATVEDLYDKADEILNPLIRFLSTQTRS